MLDSEKSHPISFEKSRRLRSLPYGGTLFDRSNAGIYVHVGDLLDIIGAFESIGANEELKQKNPEYARGSRITLDLLRRAITETLARSA